MSGKSKIFVFFCNPDKFVPILTFFTSAFVKFIYLAENHFPSKSNKLPVLNHLLNGIIYDICDNAIRELWPGLSFDSVFNTDSLLDLVVTESENEDKVISAGLI